MIFMSVKRITERNYRSSAMRYLLNITINRMGKDCYTKKRVVKDRRKRIFFKIISIPWSCETHSLRPAWIFHDDMTRCAKRKTPIHANNINAKAIVLLQNIENDVILIPRSCAMWNYLLECDSSLSLNSWTCFGCSAFRKVCSETRLNGKITEGPHTRTTSPARCLLHPPPHSCILLTPFQTRAKLKQSGSFRIRTLINHCKKSIQWNLKCYSCLVWKGK